MLSTADKTSSATASAPGLAPTQGRTDLRTGRRGKLRAERHLVRRVTLACAFALVGAALIPPLGFIVFPETLGLIGPPLPAYCLAGVLLVVPAVIGLAAARLGLNRVGYRLRGRPDREHAVALSRVAVATVLFGYGIGLVKFGQREAGITSCVPLAAAALAASWGFVLDILARPRASPVRRYAGLVFDAALISAFLHFSGGPGAAAFPLYLLVICQAGFYLGGGALVAAAGFSIAGFAVMSATTEYWQQQPLLAAGLGAGLIIVAALVGGLLAAAQRSRQQAAAAETARVHWLTALGRTIRRPNAAESLTAAPEAVLGRPDPLLPAATRAFLTEINDILDLSAIEAGDLAVRTETFDLHALVNRVVAELRPDASARGHSLLVRTDPRVPFNLRGARQHFARILGNLAIYALESATGGAVRISIDAESVDARRARLRLSVRFNAPAGATVTDLAEFAADPFGDEKPGQADPNGARAEVALALATRLAELLGGTLSNERSAGNQRRLSAILPFGVEESAVEVGLDLAQRPVLIVSDDSHFAHELAEPLSVWQADARWIGGFDAALGYLGRLQGEQRPIVVVDGRSQVLSALSFVHRSTPVCPVPPFVLFVAEAAQAEGLSDLAEDEFDAILPAPLDDDLLGNALHALPLHGNRPPPIRNLAGPTTASPPISGVQPPDRAQAGPDGRVTPISAHPRFASEPTEVLDLAAIEALREMGSGEDFLREVIDSFRVESRQLIERMRRAVASGDAVGFLRAAQALRSAAGIIGGLRVCEALSSICDITPESLEERGAASVQRLATEVSYLLAALGDLLGRAEAQNE